MTTARKILDWYVENRRELPWRGRSDAYEIWVSEVMLQQTRSETVVRYYEPFLGRFPTVAALAAASEDEVLASWSGLGYYRRARQLLAAAREVKKAGGGVPESVEGLRRLPGIGPYTAAAIASLAFGVAEPVLDGNVERVLSRYLALDRPPRTAAGRRRLEGVARELLEEGLTEGGSPGDFNQALMELGAVVCSPRRPRCEACPLSTSCVARSLGEQEAYPTPPTRRAPSREDWTAAVVRRGSELLMSRRPDDSSRLAGLWELPRVEAAAGEVEGALGRRYGGVWTLGPAVGVVRHSITHRALRVSVHAGGWEPGEVAESDLAWIEETALDATPTSSLVDKALAVYGASVARD